MHYSAYVNAEKFALKYIPNIEGKKILDVGSYDVNGTLKPIFERGIYTGLDMEEGPNVDVVSDAHNIPFENEHFDVVTSSSCFEHDDMFWVTFLEMCRVVKPGGYLYVQAPSNGPYHGWPGDNWRFYIDSWKALEKWGKREGYDIELVEHYIDETTPAAPHEGDRIWDDSVAIYRKKPIESGHLNTTYKGTKKVALISSFCDTQEKLNVLNKNIVIVKNLGIDVILISPIFLPESTTSLCDYYFQTKDNLVLEWPMRSMVIWNELYLNDTKYRMSKTYADYGWAGLSQVKKLSEIALSFEYDQFFHMIYDLKIDENVLEGFNSDRTCNMYPSKRNEKVWKAGLHFMIFDRKKLEGFISNIHIDSYLSLNGADAFDWLENLHNIFPYNFETTPVEDEIFYYEEFDFFNYSPIQEQPFFIIKDDETLENIKLLFYSVKEESPINIKIDNYDVHDVITNYKIIDLGFNKLNPKNVKIFYKEKEFDITDIINKVKHNTFRLS